MTSFLSYWSSFNHILPPPPQKKQFYFHIRSTKSRPCVYPHVCMPSQICTSLGWPFRLCFGFWFCFLIIWSIPVTVTVRCYPVRWFYHAEGTWKFCVSSNSPKWEFACGEAWYLWALSDLYRQHHCCMPSKSWWLSVMHSCIPSMEEAAAEASLQVQGTDGLHSKFLFI